MRSLISILFILTVLLEASYYGRSKIQSGSESWYELSTNNVTVYFTQGSGIQAESLIAVAENELSILSSRFGYSPADPVPVILYSSPSQFRQTEILSGELGEGVGGVTEFFKGRVIIPFNGSWNDFRHVIRHEINHAFVFDMLFNRSLYDIIYSNAPLWTMEGLAEYCSLGWDIESENEFRDMVIGEEIIPIQVLNREYSYIVYRQGQAIYHFLKNRYGEEKLRKFVRALQSKKGIEAVFDEVLGMSVEQFDEKFQEWARETYWPCLGWQESPDDIGINLRYKNRDINVYHPVLSPSGNRIAGVELNHGNFNIVVRSAFTGEVLARYLQSGGFDCSSVSPMYRICDFSPGDDSLVVVRHDLFGDRLAICSGDGEQDLDLEFPLIRDPSWSDDGRYIAFAALADGSTDVFLWDVNTEELTRLTESLDAETQLSWHENRILSSFECMSCNRFHIVSIDIDGSIDTLFTDDFDAQYPMGCQEGVIFLSTREGMPNLFLLDQDQNICQLTDTYKRISSPSRSESARMMIFQHNSISGNAIYTVNDISTRRVYSHHDVGLEVTRAEPCHNGSEESEETVQNADTLVSDSISVFSTAETVGITLSTDDFSSDSLSEFSEVREIMSSDTLIISASEEQLEPRERDYLIKPYSPRLTIDYVTALAEYDSFLGLTGYTLIVLSDILGYHRLNINANVSGDLADADAALYYEYLRHRTDIGGGIFRFTNRYIFRYEDHDELVRDTDLGAMLFTRYPFTQAVTVRGNLSYRRIQRDRIDSSTEDENADILSVGAAFVADNALWGSVGPRVGSRLLAQVEYAPGFGNFADYKTISIDFRHYVWLSRRVTLALRIAGATSWGEQAQNFYLGGSVPHRRLKGEVEDLDDIYGFYQNYGDLLRGYDYAEINGRRYCLTSVELRVPFISVLRLDAPIPITLYNGRGVFFIDVGTAFDDLSSFRGASTSGGYHFDDINFGLGLGYRINLGIFVLKGDIAWNTDLRTISPHPRHYLTFGSEF